MILLGVPGRKQTNEYWFIISEYVNNCRNGSKPARADGVAPPIENVK